MEKHMNLVTQPRGVVIALAVLAFAAAACDRHSDGPPSALAPSPSAIVIGTVPAEPSGDTEQTTPVNPATTNVSKAVETTAMPLPGQANDHSNLAAWPSQKAETAEVLKSPELAKAANSDAPTERTP
jgi:hypothetical protein